MNEKTTKWEHLTLYNWDLLTIVGINISSVSIAVGRSGLFCRQFWKGRYMTGVVVEVLSTNVSLCFFLRLSLFLQDKWELIQNETWHDLTCFSL